jgi:maltose O-acetyltransferase
MSEQLLPRRGTLAAEARLFLHLLATDPPAAGTRIRRGIGVLRARWLFRGCRCGERVNAMGHVCVQARGTVSLGGRVQFLGGMIPQELVCAEGAELSIGALSILNYGVSLRAERSIHLGERCLVASLVHVHDANRQGIAPIRIEDDVWIAHAAIIEPGVTIGTGSVVAAGSVVTADVPPLSLAKGNPARCTPLAPSERHSG